MTGLAVAHSVPLRYTGHRSLCWRRLEVKGVVDSCQKACYHLATLVMQRMMVDPIKCHCGPQKVWISATGGSRGSFFDGGTRSAWWALKCTQEGTGPRTTTCTLKNSDDD